MASVSVMTLKKPKLDPYSTRPKYRDDHQQYLILATEVANRLVEESAEAGRKEDAQRWAKLTESLSKMSQTIKEDFERRAQAMGL